MPRVLISVYDKSHIVEFAQGLLDLGWELISTGGTQRLLEEAGLSVVGVEEVTGFPEILDGRVKTLHPHIHGGILYNREKVDHQATVDQAGIVGIDLVVTNLYPFEETVANPDASLEDIIENIDIGGPSMIRAAAKNHRDVLVVTDVTDYPKVLEYLQVGNKNLAFHEYLAAKAFGLTAYYDGKIAEYFNNLTGNEFPEYLSLPYRREESLRYGENPHQRGAYYRSSRGDVFGDMELLHGKALSYNNYNDLYGNLNLVMEFDQPVCVAVKHANPCGVGIGEGPAEAYRKAYEADDTSIFGGIIGFNRTVDEATAELLAETFLEVIAAPDFSPEALDILTEKKNLRLLKVAGLAEAGGSSPAVKAKAFKQTFGGLLLQDADQDLFGDQGMELVTETSASQEDLDQLAFGWKIVKHCSSNAMVVVKDGQTLGLGHGEVRRVWALEEALDRSVKSVQGAVVASDGFFFPDTIETLQKYGIKAIVQPGGSVQDQAVIDLANEYGIAVYFTGMRHFKH